MPKIVELKTRGEELRPVAAPVRVGYTPAGLPQDKNLQVLAASLSSVQPSLTRYLAGKKEEEIDLNTAKGQQLYALHSNRESWSDFVAENPEYAKANPWIREGYLKARMANEGEAYRSWVQARANGEEAFVLGPDGKKVSLAEASPEQMTEWFQAQLKTYVDEKMGGAGDPALFADVFLPMAKDSNSELASRILSYQQEATFQKSIAEHAKLVGSTVRSAMESGAFDGEDAEEFYKTVGAAVSETLRELTIDGVPATRAYQAVISQLTVMTEDMDDDDVKKLLSIVDYIPIDDKGAVLGDVPEYRDKIETQIDAMRTENHYKEAAARRAKEEAEKEELEAHNTGLALAFMEKKGVIPADIRKEYVSKYGLEAFVRFVRNLEAAQDYIKGPDTGKGNGFSGAGTYSHVANMLYQGQSVDDMLIASLDATEAQKASLFALKQKLSGEKRELLNSSSAYVNEYLVKHLKTELFNEGEAQEIADFLAGDIYPKIFMAIEEDETLAENPAKMDIMLRELGRQALRDNKDFIEGWLQSRGGNSDITPAEYKKQQDEGVYPESAEEKPKANPSEAIAALSPDLKEQLYNSYVEYMNTEEDQKEGTTFYVVCKNNGFDIEEVIAIMERMGAASDKLNVLREGLRIGGR